MRHGTIATTGSDIVIANADGSNCNKITNSLNGEYYYTAFFHPFISKIYYSYWPGGSGKCSINKMNIDGSGSEKISNCSVLGIDEECDNNKNLIFPNPSNGIINVDFYNEFSMEIYDFTGRIILRSNTKQTDITQLNAGVYTVIIRDIDNKFIKSEKLLKQ